MRTSFMLSLCSLLGSTSLSAAQQNKDAGKIWPVVCSSAYVINASIGTTLAIRDNLPGAPLGIRTGWSANKDFLGPGTALSPGLPLLVSQAVFTMLALRPGRSGRTGLTGLAVHGVAFSLGQLSEPITYKTFRRPGAKPGRTIVVAANIILPALMAYTAVRALP